MEEGRGSYAGGGLYTLTLQPGHNTEISEDNFEFKTRIQWKASIRP